MDERELEARLRAGLERRAAQSDVTAPVADRARENVAIRRRTRWSVGAGAAAVVLIAGGVAVATRSPVGDTGEPDVADRSTAAPADGWRTEYWADVAVDVPAEWGYGGAPYDGRTACYPNAIVGPDGNRLDSATTRGFVGRPIAVTDVCALVPTAWEPTGPYVWLGADLEPGVYEYDNGYVQQTVEVNGTTVTVGTSDPALRERILGTVATQEICRARLDAVPRARHEPSYEETVGGMMSATLCAYGSDAGGFGLVYAAPVEDRVVRETRGALLGAGDAPGRRCDDESDLVVLSAAYRDPGAPDARDPLVQDAVFLPGCSLVDIGNEGLGDRLRTMNPATVAPWATGGIPAVVHASGAESDAWMYRYFIGPQG